MKLLISCDIHCGVPGRLKDNIWSINTINQYALNNNIKDVIILGDLFHDRVNLNIQVLNNVYDQLKKCKESGIKWSAFPGNHDQYMKNSWENNSLHPLEELIDLTEEVGIKTFDGRRFWIVPFIYYEKDYMDVIEKLNSKVSEEDILLTHIGIKGASLNECFLLKNWSIIDLENTKFKKIISGHFHCHQTVGKVCYPGSPIPFRYDEGVVDHGFLVLDTDTAEVEFVNIREIPSDYLPPDFITILDTDIKEHVEMYKNNNVRLVITENHTANEILQIKNEIRKNGAISVSQMMTKKEICNVKEISGQPNTPESFFKEFTIADKPDLDLELLYKLHDIVKKEADQRHVIEEVDND